jgi:hypothetical protein
MKPRLTRIRSLSNLNLENVESETRAKSEESLEDVEEALGKKYMDEDLVEKENPYGLTEFDIEEVDELLNAEKELIDRNKPKETSQNQTEEELVEELLR